MSFGVPLPHRVLIIDDSEQVAALLESWLSDIAVVAVARTGAEGLERALDFEPDLLLVDIILPGMSGFDVVETLRRRPGGLNARVIFITGLQEPANAARAMELGAATVLHKPLDAARVRQAVIGVL